MYKQAARTHDVIAMFKAIDERREGVCVGHAVDLLVVSEVVDIEAMFNSAAALINDDDVPTASADVC